MTDNKGDLISREALKDIFEEHEDRRGDLDCDWRVLIDNAPAVEVTKIQSYIMGFSDGLKAQTYQKPPMFERPQGEWVKAQGEWITDTTYKICFKCSKCKTHIEFPFNFCPNCGAEMQKDKNDSV